MAGRRILDQARKILRDASDLRSMASENELPAGPLNLGATPGDVLVQDPFKTLMDMPYICYDRKVLGGRLADEYLKQQGLRPRIRLELDGIDAIGKLVSESLGVSVLPDTGTLNEGPGGVRKWPFRSPAPERAVAFLWARGGVRAGLAEEFARFLPVRLGSWSP